nr:type II secretion system F family protein [Janibacter cremeus]
MLALALQSGRGLDQALEEVAEVAAPGAAEDLIRVAAALRWGRPMSEAWGYARDVWAPTATAFVVADAVGAPSARVLLDAATTLRETEARRLEQAGGSAAVMLVLPLGLCFLPAFIATAVIPLVAVLVGSQLS